MNIIKILYPGAIFGEIALVTKGRRTATVVAKSDCDMIRLSK